MNQLLVEVFMNFIKSIANWSYSLVIGLSLCSPLFAAEQDASGPTPWPWWHEMPWTHWGWIFPVMIFIMMIVMCLLIMRKGHWACFGHHRMMDGLESQDPIKRPWGDSSASALEIINRRYATGEIDRREYQEKKADILSSKQSAL
jgi:uncharacterized membrane protein